MFCSGLSNHIFSFSSKFYKKYFIRQKKHCSHPKEIMNSIGNILLICDIEDLKAKLDYSTLDYSTRSINPKAN